MVCGDENIQSKKMYTTNINITYQTKKNNLKTLRCMNKSFNINTTGIDMFIE